MTLGYMFYQLMESIKRIGTIRAGVGTSRWRWWFFLLIPGPEDLEKPR